MTTDIVAQMTQSEFREMLEAVVESAVEQKLFEILGDPDQGLELKESVRERLLDQQKAVASGQIGLRFEDVVKELGLE
jgi:hypothetical protein